MLLNIFCLTFVLVVKAEEENCAKDSLDEKCKNVVHSGFIDQSLNHLDQEDPILIEAIKKLLTPVPSAGKTRPVSSRSLITWARKCNGTVPLVEKVL
jgi:hypothetical protein